MDSFSFIPQLVHAAFEEGYSKKMERIHRENERNNILTITHLVLNSFLDQAICGSRMFESDTQELADLLLMLEKVLWHGFKAIGSKGVFNIRLPETNLWSMLSILSKAHLTMSEDYKCVNELNNLSHPLSKIRGFLRVGLMHKKLAEYFQTIVASPLLENYYDPWALLRHEKCISLCGSLLALKVFDCNLLLDNDILKEQCMSVDITPYIKMPTISNSSHFSQDEFKEEHDKEMQIILDQNSYLEERNRLLNENLEALKRKSADISVNAAENLNNANGDKSLIFTERLGDLEREREILQARLAEKDDAVRLLQDQLSDTKKLNSVMYEKLRSAEDKSRRLEKDIRTLNEYHTKEVDELNRLLKSFNTQADIAKKNEITAILRDELTNKSEQYSETLAALNAKQQELNSTQELIAKMERKCGELERNASRAVLLEKELIDLKFQHEEKCSKLGECERALEELGDHLSESKLKIVELKEEILPLSEAEWVKDSEVMNCKLCEVQFSVTQRKHHCRNCGSIFCQPCSATKVKLPSNSKPVRVCLTCYQLLKNRQSSFSDHGLKTNSS